MAWPISQQKRGKMGSWEVPKLKNDGAEWAFAVEKEKGRFSDKGEERMGKTLNSGKGCGFVSQGEKRKGKGDRPN